MQDSTDAEHQRAHELGTQGNSDCETGMCVDEKHDIVVAQSLEELMETTEEEDFANLCNGTVHEDVSETILKPEWDTPEEVMKRIVDYTVSDFRAEEIFLETIERGKRNKSDERRERNKEFAIFIKAYMRELLDENGVKLDLSDEELYKLLPENFSPTSVFDVCMMATVGAAGTGKSVSVRNMQSRCMDMFTTSTANAASEGYTRGMTNMNHPQCRSHEQSCKTLIKTLSIPFSMPDAQEMINTISQKDQSEEAAFLYNMQEKLIKGGMNLTEEELGQEVRKLTICMLKSLRPLVALSFMQVKNNFVRFRDYKYRLGGLSESHQFYQDPEATFEWCNDIDEMELKYATKVELKQLLKEDRDKVPGMFHDKPLGPNCLLRKNIKEMVCDQDSYRRFCMSQNQSSSSGNSSQNNNHFPPIMSQQNIMMVEEDGLTPLYQLFFHSVMTVITNMMYNPPHHHLGPACWFSSGSDTQLGAVNSQSALSYIISNNYNTVVRANFFRRNQASQDSALSDVTRVVPLIIENNLQFTNEAVETLGFNAKMSSQIRDPGHCPTGKRFHGTHKDIHDYMASMVKSNRATIPVYDILTVSDKIIDISNNKPLCAKNSTEENPYGVEERGLSNIRMVSKTLIGKKAAWKQKIEKTYKFCMGEKWMPWSHPLEIMDRYHHNVQEDSLPAQRDVGDTSSALNYSAEHDSNLGRFKDKVYRKRRDMIVLERTVARRQKREDEIDEREREELAQAEEDAACETAELAEGVAIEEAVGERPKKKAIRKKVVKEDEKKKNEKLDLEIEIEAIEKDDRENWTRGDEGEALRVTPPKRTKVFITMPAAKALTRTDHMQLRKQCAGIVEHLEVGKLYSQKACNSSRAGDQLAKFEYDWASDTVTIFSTLDFEGKGVKNIDGSYNMETLLLSALENEECVQLNMTFKRKRMFAAGKSIVKLDNKIEIVPRGVTGTVVEVMKDQTFNNTGSSAGFKLLIYGGIVHQFLLTQALEQMMGAPPSSVDGEMEMIGNLDERLAGQPPTDENIIMHQISSAYVYTVDEIKSAQYKGNISTFLDSFRTMITQIINVNKRWVREEKLTIYCHKNPFFRSRLLTNANKAVQLEMYGDVSLIFLGNHNHEAIGGLGRKIEYDAINQQNFFYKSAKTHPPTKINQWALTQHTNALQESQIVMRVGEVLIASSEPHDGKVNWHDIFGSRANNQEGAGRMSVVSQASKRNFGLMTKRNMPTKQDGDKHCYHKSFLTAVGDFMNFPPLWQPGAGPEGSDVIVKLSNGRKVSKVLFYDRTKNSATVKKEDVAQEQKQCVWDDSHVFAYPSPFIPDSAQTFHSAQGLTIKDKVFVNFESLTTQGSKKLIFDEDNSKAAVLVWATRADKPQNAQSANSEIMKSLFVKEGTVESEKARKRLKCMVRKEYMR
ncbi:tc_p027c [Abalone herpesvirus Taiwan/2004]|nr:tc_p027c [Abalone herpesvirus Taiwan/2004]